jgi:hypothetical protein
MAEVMHKRPCPNGCGICHEQCCDNACECGKANLYKRESCCIPPPTHGFEEGSEVVIRAVVSVVFSDEVIYLKICGKTVTLTPKELESVVAK